MKKLLQLAGAFVFLARVGVTAAPIEAPHKSVSASQQFVIYCDDPGMRFAVSSFTEETKANVLRLLGQQDRWKIPIVITFIKADPTMPDPVPSQVRIMGVEGDTMKIELNVSLRGDLGEARFPEQLVRAILLELEYRNKPMGKGGLVYVEPPQWLIQGVCVYLQTRGATMDVDVYKTLLDKNHLPRIANFLAQDPSTLNAASLKLYQAYSMSLLELLKGLPNGRAGLTAYIQDLPLGKDTPSVDLIKHFPALGSSEENLEKWWTLSMAAISASDRYEGLSLEETEQRLVAVLKIAMPTGKKNETKEYALEDFKEFIKMPGARQILAATAIDLQTLTTQSNVLFRPVVAEYQAIVRELQQGKVKKTDRRLKALAQYREMVLHRMDQIADYMNWFEATRMVLRSNSFEDYMKTANQIATESPKRDDAISRYLDSVELQMQ